MQVPFHFVDAPVIVISYYSFNERCCKAGFWTELQPHQRTAQAIKIRMVLHIGNMHQQDSVNGLKVINAVFVFLAETPQDSIVTL